MTDLTLTEAAALTGTSTRQLRHAVVTGKLRARTVGRAYVVARADLDAWQPPAPGASLDAYWRARGKRGTKPEAEPGSVTYGMAVVAMRNGSTCGAEVILDGSGVPDDVVDFGGFNAKRRGTQLSGGAFVYDEV